MASNRIFKELKHLQIFKQLRLSPSWWSEKPAKLAGLDGSVELHKSMGLQDRGVKKDQDHSDRDKDRDRDRSSQSKRKPTDEMIGFFCSKKSSSVMALDAPVEAPPQVGKGNAKVALSLVGYDQDLKYIQLCVLECF